MRTQDPCAAPRRFRGGAAVPGPAGDLAFEETVRPAGVGQWLAVFGLGPGPVGLAFFVWDHGVKRGNIRALGASSCAAPLISTLPPIVFGAGEARWTGRQTLIWLDRSANRNIIMNPGSR